MGTVYRARDRFSGEFVALKILHSGLGGPDEAERFSREAELLSELRHPGIVSYVAHGQTPAGQRFLAMEWLDGEDLAHRLARGPLPLGECLRMLGGVADALARAHQRGIIHRDLKPSNLFLVNGATDQVKLLDFGIARRLAAARAMTATGMIIGTPEYMAPEQARGERNLTPATDLFSLGCVLYECLVGQPPFVAEHIAAVLVRILFDEPVPIAQRRPGIPVKLAELIGRMLAKDPAQRPADATALGAALAAVGELPEPALASTVASVSPPSVGFAEQEQSLFSVVLATPSADEHHQDQTLLAAEVLSDQERQTLLEGLRTLGVAADFLAGGSLVVAALATGSATDQASRAARAALFIKERWPAATVSMATGRGAIRDHTAVGEVVEQAARSLKAERQPAGRPSLSAVFMDSLSAKLLQGRFAQTPRAGGALLLHEEKDVDGSRLLIGKPTPCVGRDAELATLAAQLEGCIEESEARVTLVLAPPGIGKSRLRHEFVRRVEKRSESVTLIMGRVELMSVGAPYGVLRDAIHKLCELSGSEPLPVARERLRGRVARHLSAAAAERIVPFLGELCNIPFPDEGLPRLLAARQEPKLMRDSLRSALLEWLAAECRAAPVLLVLDDLQWGDELTVSVLDEALRQQAGAALFLVAFARPELHQTFPRLWQGHKVQELALKGLSKKACERLIQQVLGKSVPMEAMAKAVEQSAGNALFLEELIRAMAEGTYTDQPETVLAMLQARIGRLGAGARRMIRAAAVYGQTCWHGGLAAILGIEPDDPQLELWLTALTEAELLQRQLQSRLAGQQEYCFRHALVRDAAYGLLTPADLVTGHRLAGEFLTTAGEQEAAVIAEHFERSGDHQRAAVCYLSAAEDSLSRGNTVGALRHVDRGLGAKPAGELLVQLRSLECYLAFLLDRFDRMRDASVVALAGLRPGRLGWCRAISPAIFAAMGDRDAARGRELLSVLLSTEPDADARAACVAALAGVLQVLVKIVPATLVQALYDRLAAVIAAAEPGNPIVRRYLGVARGVVATYRWPRPFTLVQEFQRALAICESAGEVRDRVYLVGGYLEWGFLDMGDVEGAQQRLLALTDTMQQSGEPLAINLWRHLLGRALTLSDTESKWQQAEDIVAPLLVQTGGNPSFAFHGKTVLARLCLLRGQLEAAEAQARAAMQFFSSMPVYLAHVAPVLIQALLGLGQPAAACQVAQQVLDLVPTLGGFGVAEVELRLWASEAFAAAGAKERAHAELADTLRQIQLRATDITDPFWRHSYLTRNASCVRAQLLAKQWNLSMQHASDEGTGPDAASQG